MAEHTYRILFAVPALDSGGPDRVFFDLLRGLDRSHFQPILVTSSPRGRYLSLLPDDVAVHVLKPRPGILGRYPVLALAAAVRRVRPDLVLTTLRMNLTALLAKPLLPGGVPLVVRQATQFSVNAQELIAAAPVKHRLSRILNAGALRRADLIVCQSEDMREDLARELGRAPEMVVIGNPIDVDWVQQQAAAEDVALEGRPSLVGVGRFMPQKGYDVLLQALALLIDEFPQIHLTLIGDGPDRSRLGELARSLRIASSVTFAGFKTNPFPFMRRADLFVSSSRYEGFPNVILEALACGTPAIATNCPGATAELVRERETGWLAPPESPTALASAIRRGLHDRTKLDPGDLEMFCRKRFSLRQIVGKYEQLFADVVQGARRRVAPAGR